MHTSNILLGSERKSGGTVSLIVAHLPFKEILNFLQ